MKKQPLKIVLLFLALQIIATGAFAYNFQQTTTLHTRPGNVFETKGQS